MPAGTTSSAAAILWARSGIGDFEHLPHLDQVRIVELIFVGLEDFHIGVGISIELLRDLGKSTPWLNCVGFLFRHSRFRRIQAWIDDDVAGQVGIARTPLGKTNVLPTSNQYEGNSYI